MSRLFFICNIATVLSRMQDQIYKIDMSLERSSVYGQEYAHIKWRFNIENILQEIISEINLNIKASKVDCALWLFE